MRWGVRAAGEAKVARQGGLGQLFDARIIREIKLEEIEIDLEEEIELEEEIDLDLEKETSQEKEGDNCIL